MGNQAWRSPVCIRRRMLRSKRCASSGILMKRLKACLWSLAMLAACSGYVFVWFRYNLHNANTLVTAVVAGIIALVSFLYSVVSPTAHRRVTQVLVGCGALVATFCAGSFLYYTWTEHARLEDMSMFTFFILLCVLSVGGSVLAWIAFVFALQAAKSDIVTGTSEPRVEAN